MKTRRKRENGKSKHKVTQIKKTIKIINKRRNKRKHVEDIHNKTTNDTSNVFCKISIFPVKIRLLLN